MKNAAFFLIIFLSLQSCGQKKTNITNGFLNNTNIEEGITSLSPQQKQMMLQDYAGWLQLFNNTYPGFIQTSAQMIQMYQQTIQQGYQISQQSAQMGYPMPRNYQQEQQMQIAIQQEQYKYQLLNYQYEFVKQQNQILGQLQQNPNDQLFNQATAYQAFLMYLNFALGPKEQQFEKALPYAIKWYFSPQSQRDIQMSIESLKAQNQAFRNQRMPSIAAGSSYFNNERHLENFSNILLNQKSWIDPSNGDKYNMDITIDRPTINGQDMIEN